MGTLGSARLPDSQQPDHHLRRALQANSHQFFRSNLHACEDSAPPGWRAVFTLPVRSVAGLEKVPRPRHRGLRATLPLEQLVYTNLGESSRARVIPVAQNWTANGLAEERLIGDRLLAAAPARLAPFSASAFWRSKGVIVTSRSLLFMIWLVPA